MSEEYKSGCQKCGNVSYRTKESPECPCESRQVRVEKVFRYMSAGAPQIHYDLKPGEKVISAHHSYGQGESEKLVLIIEGPVL